MFGAVELGRRVGATICGLTAIILLMLAVALPFQLRDQVEENQLYYRQFSFAAAFAAQYAGRNGGRLPSDSDLSKLGGDSDFPAIWHSLSASGGECDGGFKQQTTDQFTLWFWRGEWGECYAYPSGTTTLSLSMSDYFRSGLAIQWAIWWALGLTLAYFAYRLGRNAARRHGEADL